MMRMTSTRNQQNYNLIHTVLDLDRGASQHHRELFELAPREHPDTNGGSEHRIEQ